MTPFSSEERNHTDHMKPKECPQLLQYSAGVHFQLVHSGEAKPAAVECVMKTCKDKRQDFQELLFSTCMTEQNLITSAPRRAAWPLHMNHEM